MHTTYTASECSNTCTVADEECTSCNSTMHYSYTVIQDPKCAYNIVEPPLKETPNKGNLRIKDKIRSTKTSLSYSANTFITSEERKPLYNEQNNLSQKLRYSEVPLYSIPPASSFQSKLDNVSVERNILTALIPP